MVQIVSNYARSSVKVLELSFPKLLCPERIRTNPSWPAGISCVNDAPSLFLITTSNIVIGAWFDTVSSPLTFPDLPENFLTSNPPCCSSFLTAT